jgi:predicted site-specific integrase-resolvase
MSNSFPSPSEKQPLAHQFRPWCKQVGISPSTGYKYAALGKIHLIRIGGRTLITAEESDRVLKEGIR